MMQGELEIPTLTKTSALRGQNEEQRMGNSSASDPSDEQKVKNLHWGEKWGRWYGKPGAGRRGLRPDRPSP